MKEIDLLVNGLPAPLFQDDDLHKKPGRHFFSEECIAAKRPNNIKKVHVVAQAIDGLLDSVNEVNDGHEADRTTDNHRILVVDPGFYSLDWVMVSNRKLQRQSTARISMPLLCC